MKVSDLIAALESFQAAHGDLEVETRGPYYCRTTVLGAERAWPRANAEQDTKPRFWEPHFERDIYRAPEPVCRLNLQSDCG